MLKLYPGAHTELGTLMCEFAGMCSRFAVVSNVEPGRQSIHVSVQACAECVLWYQAQNRAHSTCVIVQAYAESVLWCLMQNPAHGALE